MLNINVEFPDGTRKPFPYGIRIEEVLKDHPFPDSSLPPIAALYNHEMFGFSSRLIINRSIKPVTMATSPGSRVYRRSLSYLTGLVARSLFPDRKLIIGHSLSDGFYYSFNDESEASEEDIRRLEEGLSAAVEAELPIRRIEISYEEALDYFTRENSLDSRNLLEHRNDSRIPVYLCGEYMDIGYEALVHNTSVLKYYKLRKRDQGFVLRFPRTGHYEPIPDDFEDIPLLFDVYREYKSWGKILGVGSVGQLNRIVHDRKITHFIRVAETLHNKKIAEIADRIHRKKGEIKAVFIAGPSSSGKTTFTKKLAIQLQVLGFNPLSISLDNYYKPPKEVPLDSEGKKDFETLEALNVDLFNENLVDLIEGRKTELPIFDFRKQGISDRTIPMQMEDRSILLIEGIHGLNEKLSYRIPAREKFKIFVSALTQLNLDDNNRIPTTDNRLIRRLVRDFQFRKSSALQTFRMWPSVRNGEKKYIFPYQNGAQAVFNSALDYEIAVLRPYALPLLQTVKPTEPEYQEAVRLQNFLLHFTPVPTTEIPGDSILREFIGYSNFKYS